MSDLQDYLLDWHSTHVVLAIFLVLAVLLFALFGPLRATVFRRRMLVESVCKEGDASIAVMLVHGTFARRALWTNASHQFVKSIRDSIDNVNVFRLLWSGDNSHKVRLLAASVLDDWIKGESAKKIYIIGHSHGGSIAALAASRARDARVHVLTMSTPFVAISPRYAGFIARRSGRDELDDEKRLLFGLIIYAVACIAALLAFTGHEDVAIFVIVGFAVATSAALFFSGGRAERILEIAIGRVKRHSRKLCEESALNLRPRSLTIFRSLGDEAGGALAIGQFTTWVVYAAFKTLGRAMNLIAKMELWLSSIVERKGEAARVAVLYCSLGILVAVAEDMVGPETWAEILGASIGLALLVAIALYLRLVSLLIEPLLALIAAFTALVSYLPFGFELALAGPVVSVSVETAPIGSWRIVTVDSGNATLAHSVLYDTDVICEFLVSSENAGPSA